MEHKKEFEKAVEKKVERTVKKVVKVIAMVILGVVIFLLANYLLMRLWNYHRVSAPKSIWKWLNPARR